MKTVPSMRFAVRAGLCFLCLVVGAGFDRGGPDTESKVKAAYIYNFTKFVEWQSLAEGAGSVPLRVCVLGTNSISGTLGEIAALKVRGHPIELSYLSAVADPVLQSHVCVICNSEQGRLPVILKQLQGTGVLTVSDIPGFVERGGMIGFIKEGDRVKIEINLSAARQAGLEIGAELLEVARLVLTE